MTKGDAFNTDMKIYKLWCTGMIDEDIAKELSLSLHTVRKYRCVHLKLKPNRKACVSPVETLYDIRKRIIKKARNMGSTIIFDDESIFCDAEFVNKYILGDM